MSATARADIDGFLACRRIAVVGVSRNGAHFSRLVWNAFRDRGYDLIPVRDSAAEIDGKASVASVAAISPPPDAALILLPSATAGAVANDCAAAGIRHVWAYRAIDPEPLRASGISVVSGECPLMFVPHAGGIHRIHGWMRRAFGAYPA